MKEDSHADGGHGDICPAAVLALGRGSEGGCYCASCLSPDVIG